MAAEAGASTVEGEAAEASTEASAAAAPRRGGRTQQGSRRTGGRTQQGKGRVSTRVVKTAAKATPQTRAASAGASRVQKVRQRGSQARTRARKGFPGSGPAGGSYHGVILAEFVLGVVLVAAIPFARPNKTGVSPYAGKDLIQIVALVALYWLLAIVAATGGSRARFAAWFGGLILLAVGLGEAASIATAVTTWFGAAPAATAQPAVNASVVNPETEPPAGVSRAAGQQPGTGLA